MTGFKQKPSLAGGLLLVLLAAGCADRSQMTPEALGKAAFESYQCRRCHRVGAEGGDAGPDLSFAGFRKSKEFLSVWMKDPAAWQPNTKMPNFHLNDVTRENLAAYLSTLKGQAYRSGTAPWQKPGMDDARRGEELFLRVGCATCHGREGRGGVPNNNTVGGKVPDLTKIGEGYTRDELIAKIRIGVRHPAKADANGPDPYLWMPAWGETLTPEELEWLADYLFSLYPRGASTGDDW